MSDYNENGTEDTAAATGQPPSTRPAESPSGETAPARSAKPWRNGEPITLAKNRGAQAAREGKPRNANPYKRRPQQRAWDRAFDRAKAQVQS